MPLNHFVRKVVFTLHDSFKDHIMEIDKPPFSIVRNGWGEFEINITIFFHDMNEEPVTKIHGLQIFHNNQSQRATLKKPVVNENYDEIVFCDPTEFFYHMLTDDPNETLAATGLLLPPQTVEEEKSQDIKEEEKEKTDKLEDKLEEAKDLEMEIDKAEVVPDEDMKVDDKIPALASGEMDEDEEQIKQEDGIKEENEEGNGIKDEIILRSTYEVKVGANNEHSIDVTQFFEDHNDKADQKLLAEALKHLREETEYLRNEVRNAEKELQEKRDKLRVYDQ